MNMTLTMSNAGQITQWAPADSLLVSMNIYQNGILQVKVMDLTEEFSRFKISNYGIGVEWGQLKPQTIDDGNTITSPDYLITSTTQGVDL